MVDELCDQRHTVIAYVDVRKARSWSNTPPNISFPSQLNHLRILWIASGNIKPQYRSSEGTATRHNTSMDVE